MSFQNNIRYFLLLTAYSLLLYSESNAQKPDVNKKTITVQAKVWSKDENKKVHYSDWNSYEAKTISLLDAFVASKQTDEDKHGGYGNKIKATGFFYTQKINNRWWVINPDGRKTVIRAVNSIRLNKSGEVPAMYSNFQEWTKSTLDQLQDFGFNVAGCWSDTAAVLSYNSNNFNPIAYTTQLNLLSGYASKTKKEQPDRKSQSVLSFILDDGFAAYCDKRATEISYLKNDPNLLGHFSDNELPFVTNELKEVIKAKNNSDKTYQTLLTFFPEGTDLENLTAEQKNTFLAYFAKKYFETVSKAIKKNDPNHLYLGSRIHSNAKHNKFLFEAAMPFVDIMSINYYGFWEPEEQHINDWASWMDKPFFITEFYTKAEETGMANLSGAGWIVKSQKDRGTHYQNFCLKLLAAKNCVGWHWFRYQDNDPNDAKADDSNKDSNKGIYNVNYEAYILLAEMMRTLNTQSYQLIKYFDSNKK